MKKFNSCTDQIIAELRRVPSSLGFFLKCCLSDVGPELADKFHRGIDSVVAECVEALHRYKNGLKSGESATFRPIEFPDLEAAL